MHELGHNFNFGHSKGSTTDGDHTCVMGGNPPQKKDHAGPYCYNATKIHQLIMSNGVVEEKSGIAHTGN